MKFTNKQKQKSYWINTNKKQLTLIICSNLLDILLYTFCDSSKAEEKTKIPKRKIALHSQLIPLNFASLEREKLNTFFFFQKQKKKVNKRKINSRFCKCLFMITI